MGIYEIKNKLDGMAYGGNSGDIKRRWKEHLSSLRNDRHHCIRLQRAWNKYGEAVFEFIILEVIEDPDERLAAEQVWLDIHHAAGTCYNSAITAGPAGPLAEETRRKMGMARMGNQNSLGYTHTEEFGQAVSERMAGKRYALGSKRTDEQLREQSERMMGHPVSDATRQKIAASKAKLYPAFIHRDTGEIIPAGRNLKRMCREHGLDRGHMGDVKNGKRPHHKGWVLLVETGETGLDNPAGMCYNTDRNV